MAFARRLDLGSGEDDAGLESFQELVVRRARRFSAISFVSAISGVERNARETACDLLEHLQRDARLRFDQRESVVSRDAQQTNLGRSSHASDSGGLRSQERELAEEVPFPQLDGGVAS